MGNLQPCFRTSHGEEQIYFHSLGSFSERICSCTGISSIFLYFCLKKEQVIVNVPLCFHVIYLPTLPRGAELIWSEMPPGIQVPDHGSFRMKITIICVCIFIWASGS